jgi:hypothetical protein
MSKREKKYRCAAISRFIENKYSEVEKKQDDADAKGEDRLASFYAGYKAGLANIIAFLHSEGVEIQVRGFK